MSKKVPQQPFNRPRFGRIAAAVAYSGHGRNTLYNLAGEYPGLFRKNGTATIVDFDVLDGILDHLPIAELKAPPAHRSRLTEPKVKKVHTRTRVTGT
jgi:hypothetical protein